jgi:MinD-like ATPase involved in chromosome partitioning or flagellar assembly
MESQVPPEFERLVYAVEALRAADQPIALQFMGVAGAEGTTLVASSFARAAACTQPQPVLFVDCRSQNGEPSLVGTLRQGRRLDEAVKPVEEQPNLAWARLAASAPSLIGRGGAEIAAVLETARDAYPTVVLDTPGASPFSKALSRLCDGTILVVEAGRTGSAAARAAKTEIERFGGQVIGSVLNRQREMLPHWLARRLG